MNQHSKSKTHLNYHAKAKQRNEKLTKQRNLENMNDVLKDNECGRIISDELKDSQMGVKKSISVSNMPV